MRMRIGGGATAFFMGLGLYHRMRGVDAASAVSFALSTLPVALRGSAVTIVTRRGYL